MIRMFKIDPPVGTITLIEFGQYDNGRLAVIAYSPLPVEDGGDGEAVEPFGPISVNLPDHPLPDDGKEMFFARDYSHHAATFDAMLEAGLIEVIPGIRGEVGMHGTCAVAKLTPKALANPV